MAPTIRRPSTLDDPARQRKAAGFLRTILYHRDHHPSWQIFDEIGGRFLAARGWPGITKAAGTPSTSGPPNDDEIVHRYGYTDGFSIDDLEPVFR